MEPIIVKSSHQPPLRFNGTKLVSMDFDDQMGGEVYLTLEAYETKDELILVKYSDYNFCIDTDECTPFFIKYLILSKNDPRSPELYKFCQRTIGSTRGISHDFISFLEAVGTNYDLDPYFFYLSPTEAISYEI